MRSRRSLRLFACSAVNAARACDLNLLSSWMAIQETGMNRLMRTVGAVVVLGSVAATGLGLMSEPPAAPTASATTGLAAASVESLGFLAGSWSGEMNGSYTDETWTRPQGNNIVGSFRWLKPDGTPIMFEILTITQESDAIRLRLRHFSATLGAKEEADKPMTMKLTELEGSRAVFRAEKDAGGLDHIIYEATGDQLAITVAFAQPAEAKPDAKPRKPLEFKLKKVG